MIRRINFFGTAGCGKTVLTSKVFAELKIRNYDVELSNEYIKTWAYAGKKPISYDQCYVFAKQLHAEDVFLRHVRVLVTDSPLMLNTAYSTFYNFRASTHLVDLAKEFEKDFPSLNFYIERTVPYQQSGRYQDLTQAKEFDQFLLKYLEDKVKEPLLHVKVEDFEKIMKTIEWNIEHAKL